MSSSLYDDLGIKKGADSSEVKKAFMKLAKTHHPDKGGDAEEFKKIQRAYEVLSDDDKRQMYDMTGQVPGEGGDGGGGGGVGFPGGFPPGFPGGGAFNFDIGSLFGMFGQQMGGNGQVRKRAGKPPPKVEHLALGIDKFYFGHSFQIKIDRQRFCQTCGGDGAKRKESCGTCNGTGTHTQTINMHGMMMQSRGPCGNCSGKGMRITLACDTCTGSGKISEKKVLDARVQPGMRVGDTLVFDGACSEIPEFEKAGDLHIVIDQSEDTKGWKRNGDNLEVGLVLSLAESLTGYVARLDGHPAYTDGLFVKVPAASFTGDVYCIAGLGMPVKGATGSYGDLYIRIQVTVKLTERRILSSDVGQESVSKLFAGLRSVPEGFEEGKTEVNEDVYLARNA